MQTTARRNGRVRIVLAFFSLFVFTILLSFGAYYLSGLRKAQQSSVARQHPLSIQNAAGAKISESAESAGRGPPNKFSQLIAMATKAAEENGAAVETLIREIEPASVSKEIDLGGASRDDLDALRMGLDTAIANADMLMPRYLALLKSEHDKVENYARSLNPEKDSITKVLATIDKQHAEIAGLTSQVLMARADFYRAYQAYVALLLGEFGSYKVANGQFVFPAQRTVDRYNIAAHAMAVAAKRLAELEQERRRSMLSQQAQWRQFASQSN